MLNYIRIIKEKNLVTGHGVFPVYLDSPMAVEATGVFKDNMMDCYNEETKELVKRHQSDFFPGSAFSITSSDSVAINFNENRRLSSRQPACDVPACIRHHLKHNLWRPECTICLLAIRQLVAHWDAALLRTRGSEAVR